MKTVSSHNSWVQTALAYADIGWRLVPVHIEEVAGACSCKNPGCTRVGNHARFPAWKEECSNDKRDILSWGDMWERCNLSVVTGGASGVIVLEVNLQEDGNRTLGRLEAEYGSLPITWEYGIAKEKRYYLFRHSHGSLPTETILGRGVTLWGDGSLVPVPPTLEWDRSIPLRWNEEPGCTDLSVAPEWLLERIGIQVPKALGQANVEDSKACTSVTLPFRSGVSLCDPCTDDTRWLVKPWVATGAITLVVGTPKVAGKTTWLLNLTRCVLEETPFLQSPSASSPVVYLTEQGTSSFNRALRSNHLTDPDILRKLNVLYASQVKGLNWSTLIQGCIDQCIQTGARMLLIDSLDRFAGFGSTTDTLSEHNLIEPLQEAADKGIAVVAVYQQFYSDGILLESIHRLGKLASAADIILSLKRSPGGRPSLRQIETLSRFDDTPESLVVDFDHGTYRNALHPLPLFETTTKHDTRGDGFVDIPASMIIN